MSPPVRKLDPWTLLLWLGLAAVSLVALYSTTHGPAAEYIGPGVQDNFARQFLWIGVSIAGIAATLLVPVRFLRYAAYPAYAATLVLLVLCLVMGVEVHGTRAWLALGPLRLQVSELAKVGTVLAVAQLLSERHTRAGQDLSFALKAAGLIVAPALLVILQNDLGTALVFFGLVPIMLFWSGLSLSVLLLMVSPAIAGYFALVSTPAALGFAVLFTGGLWAYSGRRSIAALAATFTAGVTALISFVLRKILQPYQVDRLLSFTNPGAEQFRQGVGFHLVQSKAALYSGGIWGTGFMQGPQTQGAYVPEQTTDFIFSVVAEEFGLVGSLVVLGLLAALLLRLIKLGADVKHPFGSIVAAGAVGVYLIHIFINIGMVTGMLPVIGLPLPFLSYGGSAMLANTALLAIVLNTHMRREDLSIYGY
ncbi:rod shape-determining protein RodA [Salinibacter ruber]|uniref:Cell wall polymerase n=1 Tax=Salinibacter ruber TaxID=146919 RepID=A0A9X2QTB2_9BACT|nr:rod shape-determining protein RodA [Salinibacter ruber]MCS3613622.1 rod shape determining protein RodA [Salinibacter ruber]MCS3645149.1 rod shape determining protein RodA [Salinibacter ruber]MCS3674898.1 rod shape determining protein RodA [Salinibacter ruber]MCS3751287.1 rod shape determining protein RodA [Salinibacter ruber]MCS3784640.1 rod shape determining protein RodA [Salinibacter ruber]